MVADPVVFNEYLNQLPRGFVWNTAVIKGMLVAKTTWTPDPDDTYVLNATGAGAVEAASTAHRVTIPSKSTSRDDTNNRALLTANTVTYSGIGPGTAYDTFVLFNFVTNDTDSWLLTAFDLGAHTSDGGIITFAPNIDGIYELVQGP